MTLNYPGPYQVRLYYTTTPASFPSMQHVAKYNVILAAPLPTPGDPFSAVMVQTGSGGTIGLDIVVNAWVAMMKGFMANAANNTIDYAELWKYDPLSFNASFVSAYAIAVAGTSAAGAVAAGQVIHTYRTAEGGIMKLSFMEMISTPGLPDTPPFANADQEAIRQYTSVTPRPWVGADTSYPFAAIALYPGQNEALFERRYRSS